MIKVRIEAVVEVPEADAPALISQALHPARQGVSRALSETGTVLSLTGADHDALRQAEADATADAERRITANAEARARRALEDAHEALDSLRPCPPRRIVGGGVLTVSGRIDWYREHAALAAIPDELGQKVSRLCDSPACLPCSDAREAARTPA